MTTESKRDEMTELGERSLKDAVDKLIRDSRPLFLRSGAYMVPAHRVRRLMAIRAGQDLLDLRRR